MQLSVSSKLRYCHVQHTDETAIEHLFVNLYMEDLMGLFKRAFEPKKITTTTNGTATVDSSSSDRVVRPPPDTSPSPLDPHLAEFARNIHPPQVPDEAHYAVKKYYDDISEYAERTFEGDMEEEEDEEGDDSGSEEEHGGDDCMQRVESVDRTEEAATGSNDDDDTSVDAESEASEGTLGEITNWSFSNPDPRSEAIVKQSVTGHLQKLISGAEAQAAFCCGGSVPIGNSSTSDNSSTSVPVVLRFDTADGNVAKVIFGGDNVPSIGSDTATWSAIDVLLQQCQPASFGVGGEEVYDESYRKALKLDGTKFSSNLHPYDLGILTCIAKTLLSTASSTAAGAHSSRNPRRAVQTQYLFCGR